MKRLATGRMKRVQAYLLGVIAVFLLPSLVCRIRAPARRVISFPEEPSLSRSSTGELAKIGKKNPHGNEPLRAAIFNIAHGRGRALSNLDGGTDAERVKRLDQISDLIRTYDCDIVVLNEVDFDCSWSGHRNQAKWIAKQSGFPYVVEQRNFDARFLGWTWKFGNAVLSKYKIASSSNVCLPASSRIQSILVGDKQGIDVSVQYRDQLIRVLGLHLSPHSEKVRCESVTVVNELISHSLKPTIVMGDLNSSPTGFPVSVQDTHGQNAMDLLETTGHLRRHQHQPVDSPIHQTFPSDHPNRIIDWILITNQLSFKNTDIIPTDLSDHRMVVADILVARSRLAPQGKDD